MSSSDNPSSPSLSRANDGASSSAPEVDEAAPRIRARVHVFPRREILDPQGRAIHQTSNRLGFGAIEEVRAGKAFDIELRAMGDEEARSQLRKLAEQLLSNPITEDYTVEILAGEPA